MSAARSARGIRLNNPGNIRHSHIVFQGQSRSQPDDAFVSFDGPEWGLRAIAKILLSYEHEGFTTARAIVNRWAPPSENDTKAYLDDFCQRAGVLPDAPLNLTDPQLMLHAVEAIVQHENGSQPYPACTVIKALQLAGLKVARAA